MANPEALIAVGVNGPGAMGSGIVRVTEQGQWGLQVTALSHYREGVEEGIAQLIQDPVLYGHQNIDVRAGKGELVINGRQVRVLVGDKPEDIPWPGDDPVEMVFECARAFNAPGKAAAHLREGGPFKVILSSTPSGNEPCPIIVYGVNQDIYDPRRHNVISAATCSTNALVVAVDVLQREFGLEALTATTIHALTSENEAYDGVSSGPGIVDNIIPETTGAARTLGKVLPDLEGKSIIRAVRVPISTGSRFSITAIVEKTANTRDVVEAFKNAAAERLNGILGFSERPVSAASVRGTHFAAIVQADKIEALSRGRVVQVEIGYDNVDGYIAQMLRVGRHVAEQGFR